MALKVKNPEAHRLAQELAEVTGTSLTDAVTEAFRESLASRRRHQPFELLWAEVVEIQRFVSDLPYRDTRSAEEVLIYDRHGLPG